MATINGTPVNFGFASTAGGISITGLSGVLLQSAENAEEADHEDVRNGTGDIVARAWYDFRRSATLEWVVTGTSLAAAITNTAISSLLPPGTILVVAACASRPELAATWEVQSSRVTGSNTTCARINIQIEKRTGITAVAT